MAETWLEARAGIEPAHGPFLVRVLNAIVYPDLPEWLVVGCAVLVCVANSSGVSVALSSPGCGRSVVTENRYDLAGHATEHLYRELGSPCKLAISSLSLNK